MKQICLLIALACLAISPTVAEDSSKVFKLEARFITGYKSLCDVEPKLSPESVTLHPGAGYSFGPGCADFDNKAVFPLLIKVKNTAVERTSKFTIPLLSDITIRTRKGFEPAVAIYVPWGSPRGFATATKGVLEVDLAPNSTIELLYLVPKPLAKPTINIKNYGSLNLSGR